MNNSVINQYIKEVSAELCCDAKTKRRFINELRVRIEDFSQTIAGVSFNKEILAERFGSPKDIADSFIQQSEPSKIRNLIRNTSKKRRIMMILGYALSALIVALLLYKIYLSQWLLSGYAISVIYEDETEYVPEGSDYRQY